MSTLKDKKITVILGGVSKEREISLKTGNAIFKALEGAGYQVSKFDPKEDDFAELSHKTTDIAFIALHGRYGEDGCVQGLLESLKIPYTGSGVLSSAVCYDKIWTKQYLKNFDVLTPEFWIYDTKDDLESFMSEHDIRLPVVTKPNREGSTIGMKIVKESDSLKEAILEAAKFCDKVLIEKFVKGMEVTVSVLNGEALPSVEIAPKSGFYDYESKYTPGKTEYFVPARISASLEEKLKVISEKICQVLNCRGAPRVDFMIDERENPYFLEVNTIPGMTETSLLPKAANGRGIDFGGLCERILASAKLDD